MNVMPSLNKQNHSTDAMLYALSRLFERGGYYGFRSVLILYLVSSTFEMTSTEAIGLYGTFASFFYLAKMIGGILGDLVLGNRIALLIGVGLQCLGVLFLCLPNTIGLYTGITLLILGSGLYDPNLLALFGKQYLNKAKVIDSGFGLFYIGINIGAFIGILCVTLLSEVEMYYGFLLAAGFYIIAISIILGIKPNVAIVEEEPLVKKQNYNVKPRNVFLVIVVLLISSLFWVCYELTAPAQMEIGSKLGEIALELTGLDAYGLFTKTNSVVIFFIGGLLSLLWFHRYSSSIIKIAIGFLMAVVSLASLLMVEGLDELNGLYLFVSSLVVLGIAEFFIIPPILSVLVLRSNPKYLAIIMGAFGFVSSLLIKMTSSLSGLFDYLDSSQKLPVYVAITLFLVVGVALIIIHFVLKASEARDQSLNSIKVNE